MLKSRNRRAVLFAAVLAIAQIPAQAADAAASPKVVLELFTSQGCSSCPAADALLGHIAAMREDVIALSFHVDYWNYIGWKDLFATPATTARQRAYALALGVPYVYTPQLVIDGARHVSGSNRDDVVAAIEASRNASRARVPVALASRADGGLTVEIASAAFDGAAAIWLVNVDRRHTTTVDAGENRGRTLVNHHVVRAYRRIGTWTGDVMTIELGSDDVAGTSETAGDGCAVLVQADHGIGRIVGAEAVWIAESRS